MENMPPMGSPPMGGRSPSELSLMNSEAAQPHPAQMQHLQQMQHQRHLNGPPGPPGGPLPGPPGPPGSVPNPNEPEISAIKLVKVTTLLSVYQQIFLFFYEKCVECKKKSFTFCNSINRNT